LSNYSIQKLCQTPSSTFRKNSYFSEVPKYFPKIPLIFALVGVHFKKKLNIIFLNGPDPPTRSDPLRSTHVRTTWAHRSAVVHFLPNLQRMHARAVGWRHQESRPACPGRAAWALLLATPPAAYLSVPFEVTPASHARPRTVAAACLSCHRVLLLVHATAPCHAHSIARFSNRPCCARQPASASPATCTQWPPRQCRPHVVRLAALDRPFSISGVRLYKGHPSLLSNLSPQSPFTGKAPFTSSSIFHHCAPWTGHLTNFSSPCAGQAEAPNLGEARGPVRLARASPGHRDGRAAPLPSPSSR
jgi:hypothetical protein